MNVWLDKLWIIRHGHFKLGKQKGSLLKMKLVRWKE